jgi:hypothetical protein
MKKTIATMGLTLGFLCLAFVTIAHASWFTDEIMKVRKWFSVGTNTKLGTATIVNNVVGDKALVIRAASGQTADILDIQNSSGTSLVSFGSAGGVTNSIFFAEPSVTSDPCPGWATTYGAAVMARAVFHNGTSGYKCECDSSTDDLKLDADTDGSSVACF